MVVIHKVLLYYLKRAHIAQALVAIDLKLAENPSNLVFIETFLASNN